MSDYQPNNVQVLFRWTDARDVKRHIVLDMPQAPVACEKVDIDFHEGDNVRAVTLHVVSRRWQITVADGAPESETVRATLACELVSEKVVDK